MKPAAKKNNPTSGSETDAPTATSAPTPQATALVSDVNALRFNHLKMGWWGLLIFLTFGIFLEAMHGFKLGYYLNLSNQTRRFMWTLAHAHGTLLALINIGFAASLPLLKMPAKSACMASSLLMAATVLMPAGFFLGGLVFYGGDPGFGILLLPLGAIFLLASVFLIARAAKP